MRWNTKRDGKLLLELVDKHRLTNSRSITPSNAQSRFWESFAKSMDTSPHSTTPANWKQRDRRALAWEAEKKRAATDTDTDGDTKDPHQKECKLCEYCAHEDKIVYEEPCIGCHMCARGQNSL
jgi:hypothetical protein